LLVGTVNGLFFIDLKLRFKSQLLGEPKKIVQIEIVLNKVPHLTL
jgi:hypothetical protein